MNFFAPGAAVPSRHGSQLSTTRSTTQKSPNEPGPAAPPRLRGAVQPCSRFTSPAHTCGLARRGSPSKPGDCGGSPPPAAADTDPADCNCPNSSPGIMPDVVLGS